MLGYLPQRGQRRVVVGSYPVPQEQTYQPRRTLIQCHISDHLLGDLYNLTGLRFLSVSAQSTSIGISSTAAFLLPGQPFPGDLRMVCSWSCVLSLLVKIAC